MTPELLEQLADEFAEKVAARVEARVGSGKAPAAEVEEWRLFTEQEAAARFGRSARWLRERRKRGDVRYVRLDDGRPMYRLEDLQAFVESKLVPALEDEETPARLRAVGDEWWQA